VIRVYVWKCGWPLTPKNFEFFIFVYYFDVLILKINKKNKKIYYLDVFKKILQKIITTKIPNTQPLLKLALGPWPLTNQLVNPEELRKKN